MLAAGPYTELSRSGAAQRATQYRKVTTLKPEECVFSLYFISLTVILGIPRAAGDSFDHFEIALRQKRLLMQTSLSI